MQVATNEEHRALGEAIRAVLTKHSTSAQVREAVAGPRGFDEGLWSVLCGQIGIASLTVPEDHGGLGVGLHEASIVAEELGRTLTPSPFLSAVLAAQAILATRSADNYRRLLPTIASGETVAALAWSGSEGNWGTERLACSARRANGTYVVDGQAHYVLDGDTADVLLVPAYFGDEIVLLIVDPHQSCVHRRHCPAMDLTRRMARIDFTGASAVRIGNDDFRVELAKLRDTACLLLAAEQVGAAERALELTVEYSKQRIQFSRPIGGFQALKHRMADLYVLVQTARSAAYAAIDSNKDRERRAAVARVYCTDALSTVTSEMIQIHGGVAITWEHDAHLYFKRAHGSAQLFGQPHEHLARLGHIVGVNG